MGTFVEKDDQGRKVYRGFLSSSETKEADALLEYLQNEIPNIGAQLSKEYGDTVLYKYYMGKKLSELLEQFGVPEKERLYFWDEIKNFAADKERKRQDGSKSKTRKFYEQCYQLSKIEKETVEKMSWRQWQDLLDRTANREDERIFKWIGIHEPKIKEKEWRSFEKALNLFLKKKDTSIFEDDELFSIYEMLLCMVNVWNEEFQVFSVTNSKSAKIKNKSKWENKFYEFCLKTKKANKKNLTAEECKIIFNTLMLPNTNKV